MSEAEKAISAQDYAVAAKKLKDSRQVFNQLSSYYQELTSSFLGIDNKASDSLRKKALEAAQMRDQATYQLALVHRAQNQPSLAVPLLIEIIRSQQPTRDLGQKSYQQLLEMGFVDVPYRGLKSGQSTPSQPPQPANQPAP
jgi:thioredoxin-like negative regulator of GroEL